MKANSKRTNFIARHLKRFVLYTESQEIKRASGAEANSENQIRLSFQQFPDLAGQAING